jgi:hypothetical protein
MSVGMSLVFNVVKLCEEIVNIYAGSVLPQIARN